MDEADANSEPSTGDAQLNSSVSSNTSESTSSVGKSLIVNCFVLDFLAISCKSNKD